jgi:SAM-dependent methyltransferase
MPPGSSLLARFRNRNLPLGALVDRRQFILERSVGRRVLHLGCVDKPYLEEKLANGTLLHEMLVERAAKVVGVDSDPEGVSLFEARGWPTLCADVEQLPELNDDFDLVVAGEIIEHLSNPGLFLDSLAHRLRPGTEVILTTPSAYAIRRYWRFLIGHEQVHPDHVAYYSPLTLREAVARSGYVVDEVHPYPIGREYTTVPWYYRAVERVGITLQPWTADGLILVGRTPSR